MPEIDFSKFGEVETVAMSRIQKVSSTNLHRSWLHVPHVTQHDEADITEMDAFRRTHADEAEKRGFKLTPVAFLVKAAVAALKQHPRLNASLAPSGDAVILKKYFHIGIAVDTEDGLVVPVLRDADQLGLYELAEKLAELSARARERKLKIDELQGASFTITSLGGIGGTAFTPIVNAPEVAILGVARAAMKPVWRDAPSEEAGFEPRLMLPLSLSYDHRVVDGALAARFVTTLSWILGDLRRMLL
jgi:pyruvate dehydrogenase E2 component (dihydrolipoamide acetyltransferase)